MRTQQRGRFGEAEAAEFLRRKGYRIIAANYRTRFGEIDLIASGNGIIVFVEVKLRESAGFAYAMEAVDSKKRKKIIATAEIWLSENTTPLQPRFDVIEVYAPGKAGEKPLSINHIENAF